MLTRCLEAPLSLLLQAVMGLFCICPPRPTGPQSPPKQARVRAQMVGW